jgi:hypothetical protein
MKISAHDTFHKYLKNNAKPQQLDLFGWSASDESASTSACRIASSVCHHIASAAALYHGLSSDFEKQITDFIISHHGCDNRIDWRGVCSDYVHGFALTMSFSPMPIEQTFLHSDRIAMAEDWASAQSDLIRICEAVVTAERLCNERSAQHQRRESEAAE